MSNNSDNLRTENTGIQKYEDQMVALLKKTIKKLENIYNKLIEKKSEIEKLIFEFDIRFTLETSDLVLKILKLKSEKLRESIENSSLSDEKLKKAKANYEEATKDYDDYRSMAVKNKKQIIELTEPEKKELKDKYRQASKLCHPDAIGQKGKDEAHKTFNELCQAYKENNLSKVSEILQELESGQANFQKNPYSDDNVEGANLERLIGELKKDIASIKKEIGTLKASRSYKLAYGHKNWDKYFSKVRRQLEQELKKLNNA